MKLPQYTNIGYFNLFSAGVCALSSVIDVLMNHWFLAIVAMAIAFVNLWLASQNRLRNEVPFG
jgi:hypothetical protein